jgi:hypothetical protein
MQARTARFDDAIRYGGKAVAIADVYRGGILLRGNIPLISGKVKVDNSASQHRSLDVVVVDDGTLKPINPTDLLMPYGNEIKIRSGFEFGDGSQDLISLGLFRIDTSEMSEPGAIKVTGQDRSVVVQEARFEIPHVIAGGTTDVAAIKAIIDARIAGLNWTTWPTTGGYTMQWTTYEEADRSGDPWSVCQEIAANSGREVLFDPNGQPIIRAVDVSTVTNPVWTYQPGVDNILTSSSKKHSAQGVRNVWVVMGENSAAGLAPVRAVAEITDVASPIFPSPGGFGRRPAFYVSSYLTTTAQCQATADKMKVDGAGFSEVVGFTAVPHLAHESRDVVRVVDPDTGLDALTVLTSFDLDIFMSDATTFATTGRRVA